MIFLLNNFNYVRFLLNYGKLPKEEAIIEVVAKIMHPVMKIQESIRYSGTKVVVLHSQYFFFFFGKLPKEEAIVPCQRAINSLILVACGGV